MEKVCDSYAKMFIDLVDSTRKKMQKDICYEEDILLLADTVYSLSINEDLSDFEIQHPEFMPLVFALFRLNEKNHQLYQAKILREYVLKDIYKLMKGKDDSK